MLVRQRALLTEGKELGMGLGRELALALGMALGKG